jgi:hypothetical protein
MQEGCAACTTSGLAGSHSDRAATLRGATASSIPPTGTLAVHDASEQRPAAVPGGGRSAHELVNTVTSSAGRDEA